MARLWDRCGTRSMVLSAKLPVYNVGGVGEWLKPAVLKTVRLERVSGVRIPPPPPDCLCTVRRHPLQNVLETYFTPSGQKGCLKAAESFPQDRCNRDRS